MDRPEGPEVLRGERALQTRQGCARAGDGDEAVVQGVSCMPHAQQHSEGRGIQNDEAREQIFNLHLWARQDIYGGDQAQEQEQPDDDDDEDDY